MKKLISITAVVLILLLLSSGIFAKLAEFFTWLFILDYSKPAISIAGDIVVRVLTFIVSYTLVGIIFGLLGQFNKKAMRIAYAILSTLTGFVLTYIVWCIEEYLLIIIIVLTILAVLAIGFTVTSLILTKKKEKNQNAID